MILRENYFFKNKHKVVKVNVDSSRWEYTFSKSLVVPTNTSNEELQEMLEETLGHVHVSVLSEDRVISLVNSKEKMGFNTSSKIDNIWQDGIQFNIAVYFPRKKTANFTVVGDLDTTDEEIHQLATFLCLDTYEISCDEIGDCWIKRV